MNAFDPGTSLLTHKGKLPTIALVLGGVGLAASAAGWALDADRFYMAWLVAIVYWLTIALGALFFVMLQHVTGAVWSVVVRRIAEAMTTALPFLLVLFVPLVFGMHTLFHWSHAEAVAHDPILQWKSGYLNVPFALVRLAVYFGVWILLGWWLNRHSLAQDRDGDPMHTVSMRKISAGGMFLYAFSSTFFAFDWLMSLNPHWYSTIFGVYVFAAGFLATLALMTVYTLRLSGKGDLHQYITADHIHDFGRLLFAFTVFWTYIAGAQYYLIWYANIPEETVWFLTRWEGSWKPFSIALILLHFAVPFVTLAFHRMKRTRMVLGGVAVLLLVMHYADMYWLVMPTFFTTGVSFSWLDIAAWLGVGGVVMWRFATRYASQPIIPLHDPKRADSIAWHV